MEKVVQGLVTAAAGGTYYSPAVTLGDHNSAMFEVWLLSGTGNVTVTMEGSNDLQNWEPDILTAGGKLLNAAPQHAADANTSVIPYAHVRLKIVGAAASCLVDAAIRTFHT